MTDSTLFATIALKAITSQKISEETAMCSPIARMFDKNELGAPSVILHPISIINVDQNSIEIISNPDLESPKLYENCIFFIEAL